MQRFTQLNSEMLRFEFGQKKKIKNWVVGDEAK